MRLWELHRMAMAYGQDPAVLAGIDPGSDGWLAWQFRRAVFAFGEWFERQREATVERPAPKNQKPTIRVPKFSEGQLRAMIGLDGDEGAPGSLIVPDPVLDEQARALLRGDAG